MNLWDKIFGKKKPESPHSDGEQAAGPAQLHTPAKGGVSGLRRSDLEKREIRVFISSTFRDMMRERDLFVKEVFPELRRKCAGRFVTFTEVDLRWGITEEQAAEGQVLPLCLAEIERSRPYFIGLLGERYGWIPDEIRPEVIEREPWLKEHVQGRTSVTELEILHGVLNDPEMENLAFFCFRAPAYAESPSLSEEERLQMVERNIPDEVEKYGEEEASRRTQERRDKLSALKQRIRDSGLPVVETYADPEEVAEIIRSQFDDLIDRLYPADQTPDPVVQERILHEAYAQNKLFACIDRPEHLKALTDYAAPDEHHGTGLVVTGESGCGKTALLAGWSRDWAKSHPDDFLCQHYFGATPDSASPEGFLRRLMGELKARFGISEELPTSADDLRNALPVWIARTTGKGRIILMLDGLNQVQGDEPDRRLRFLPRHFPPHVTVIASTLAGPALDALRERGWTEHELPLASEAEVDVMVGAYLSIYARALEPALRSQMVTAPGCRSPLFLRTVLEELRQFGSFEKLPERVAHYLEASDPKELFLRVIRRWQSDFDAKDPEEDKPRLDLVRRALSHLWAARQGLSEPEWLDLLGDGSQPLPRAFWTPLFLALEPHLSRRAGLFGFGHDFLRQAVQAAFMSEDGREKAAHLVLADYFEWREADPRKAVELPWQLEAAGERDRLRACLLDIALCSMMLERDENGLLGYWVRLREERVMGRLYVNSFEQWVAIGPENLEIARVANQIATFLDHASLYAEAEPLYAQSTEILREALGEDNPDYATGLNNRALLYFSGGQYQKAEPLYVQATEILRRCLGEEHPDYATSLNNLALLYDSTGQYQKAEPLYVQAMQIRRKALGQDHPDYAASLNNLALLYDSMGQYRKAEPLYVQAMEIRRKALGEDHPDYAASLNNLAEVYRATGQYEKAEPLHLRALRIRLKSLGPDHPDYAQSLNNRALLYVPAGKYEEAEKLLVQATEIRRKALGPDHPDYVTIVGTLATVYCFMGQYEKAEPLFKLSLDGLLKISSIIGHPHPSLETYIANYAFYLQQLGKTPAEIHETLQGMLEPFGMSLDGG